MILPACTAAFALTTLAAFTASAAGFAAAEHRPSDDALKAWRAVTAAMQSADREALRQSTTDDAYAQLTTRPDGQPFSDDELKTRGEQWSRWEVRVASETDKSVEIHLGPKIKEHTVTLVNGPGGWKLTRWIAGE